jgi:hypothetical protein
MVGGRREGIVEGERQGERRTGEGGRGLRKEREKGRCAIEGREVGNAVMDR